MKCCFFIVHKFELSNVISDNCLHLKRQLFMICRCEAPKPLQVNCVMTCILVFGSCVF